MKAQRGIQSIEVGGALLQALVDAGASLPLRELAQRAGMSSAKAHPYLVSYGKLRLIEQDPITGHYGLGPFALQLGLVSLQLLSRYPPSRRSATRSATRSPSPSSAATARRSCTSTSRGDRSTSTCAPAP